MKTKLYIVFIFIMVCNCKDKMTNTVKPNQTIEAKKNGYTILGEAAGVLNGIRVYIKSSDEKGRSIPLDTAIVINERFKFESTLDTVALSYVYVDAIDSFFPFILENGNINLEFDRDQVLHSKISGTKFNNALNSYHQDLKALNDELNRTHEIYKNLVEKKESTTQIIKQLETINATIKEHPIKFIETHPKNPFSLLLLDNLIQVNTVAPHTIMALYDQIDSTLIGKNLGKLISSKMEAIRAENDIILATNIGKTAPAFSAPSPNGSLLSLNAVKGKVTLIDFWASWSKFCRIQNPNKVELYKKYHDKGLEIISISLDGNQSQKNPKSEWVKAIKEDKLNWHHISNLNYFYDTIVTTYNVKSLPSSFLLDDKGKIVAKDLSYKELDDRIADLLN